MRKKLSIFIFSFFLGLNLIGQNPFRVNLGQPVCDSDSFEIELVFQDSIDLDSINYVWLDEQMDTLATDTAELTVFFSGLYYVSVSSFQIQDTTSSIQIDFPTSFNSIQDTSLACDILSYSEFHGYNDSRFSYKWINLQNGDEMVLHEDTGYEIVYEGIDTGMYVLEYIQRDSLIEWNQDSLRFDTLINEIPCFVDTFSVQFRFSAEPSFNAINACFGDSLSIENNSSYNAVLQSISYEVDTTNQILMDTSEVVTFPSLENGQSSLVNISIVQSNGCNSEDTVTIESKLVPEAIFTVPTTHCENEELVIMNESKDRHTSGRIIVNPLVDSVAFGINEDPTFNTDSIGVCEKEVSQFGTGLINFNISIINNHGNGLVCSDETMISTFIHDVNEIELVGLATVYCQNEYDECIDHTYNSAIRLVYCDTGLDTNEGLISGGNVSSNGNNGTAMYIPEDVDTFQVTGILIDANNCTVRSSKITTVVSPITNVSLSSLDSAYCSESGQVELVGFPTSGSFVSTLEDNNELFSNGNLAIFEPLVDTVMQYIFVFENIDSTNVCAYEDCDTTTVYPLPSINLDSFATIENGESIILGVPAESNTTYQWSTMDTTSFIEVDNPGVYSITAVTDFGIITCDNSDTIQVNILSATSEILYQLKVYPNPFTNRFSIKNYPSNWEWPKLFDLSGKEIGLRISELPNALDVHVLDKVVGGIYILRFPNGQSVRILRL